MASFIGMLLGVFLVCVAAVTIARIIYFMVRYIVMVVALPFLWLATGVCWIINFIAERQVRKMEQERDAWFARVREQSIGDIGLGAVEDELDSFPTTIDLPRRSWRRL